MAAKQGFGAPLAIIAGGLLLILGLGFVGVKVAQKLTRGVRNNNPGNLRITNIPWRGKVPARENTDGDFEQFRDADGVPGHVWGLRALYMDIRGDALRDGLNTVAKLITSYAPPTENNTAAYIAAVAKAVGKPATAQLTADDLPAVLKAIVAHENFGHAYPEADVRRAIGLA